MTSEAAPHFNTMAKLFFYDLETTGTKVGVHDIHQIAGVLVYEDIIGQIELKVAPRPDREIDPAALAIAGVTEEQVRGYPRHLEMFNRLTQILGAHCNKYDKADKFHLVGYNNAGFDNAFLRDWWADSYFGSFFWADTIDVMVLASQAALHYRPTMPNFKLATVCAHFGVQVDPDRLHDAAYDVNLTRQLYAKLTGI